MVDIDLLAWGVFFESFRLVDFVSMVEGASHDHKHTRANRKSAQVRA
jgi:hypothetical protein